MMTRHVPEPDRTLTDEQYRGMYEAFYVRAGDDLASVPWASLAPHPALARWLDVQPPPSPGRRALVIGCGLGDDAERVAAAGYAVTGFDFSPTAIDIARRRFSAAPVDYLVADLFPLPETWRGAFDLVVEIRTLQSMPPDRRAAATAAIAATVAPGGTLFLHSLGAPEGARFDGPPWPVTRSQLAGLAEAGLLPGDHETEDRNTEDHGADAGAPSGPVWSFTSVYRREAAT